MWFSLQIEATVTKLYTDAGYLNCGAVIPPGQYVRLLAPQTLFVIRSDLQFSSRALVPLEQFGLGGLGNIRGYPQDILLTDNGFLASAEVQLPVLLVKNVNSSPGFKPGGNRSH